MDQEVMLSEQCSGDINPQKCPLEIMFHGLEQVLLLFRQRKQTPLLKKITAGVEAMCGRSFTKHHLAQIIFVQPGESVTAKSFWERNIKLMLLKSF